MCELPVPRLPPLDHSSQTKRPTSRARGTESAEHTLPIHLAIRHHQHQQQQGYTISIDGASQWPA
jgi:hypothetical protein